MTEEQWRSCEIPATMLEFLGGRASERKRRLFSCACVREVWGWLTDGRSRAAVEVAERFADRLASPEELLAAAEAARAAEAAIDQALQAMRAEELDDDFGDQANEVQLAFAKRLGEISGEASAAWMAVMAAAAQPVDMQAKRRVKPVQCALLRDLFGPLPFRPLAVDPRWLAWNGGTIPMLAKAIYEERAFARLAVLGDALEEAGCTAAEMLDHCRQGDKHVRGCWVVDLLLGKE